MRILVVDDQESIRMFLEEILIEEGYTVSTATSAEEALRLFGINPFPIVMTDIRMDGMSGIDLLQRIKKIRNETLVIIMTSQAGGLGTISQTFGHGAYDFLLKPFESIEQVLNTIARAREKLQLT